MVDAVGPVFCGGFTTIATSDGTDKYSILFLAEKHNDELQREGKAPVYYWMPSGVRIARRGGNGDYKFHLIHFVGVQSEDTTVGVQGTKEVAGGVLAVTTTSAFPPGVLEDAQKKLTKQWQGNADKYWGWRNALPPQFRPMPIVANVTTLSNLSPLPDGTVPAAQPGAAPAPAPATPATPASPAAPPGGPRGPRSDRALMRMAHMPRTVPLAREFTGRDADLSDNLNAWYFRMQGQGPGSIDPLGENAFSGLLGSLPTAILWQGFHGAYSPISVSQTLKLQVWTQSLRLTVDGNWDRVFEHFSANAKGRMFWFNADISVELNKMMISGTIKVHLEIDGTVPGADKMREEVNKRIDSVRESFMTQAQKRIFDPAPPDVKPAEASTGGGILGSIFGFGGGFALKYRRDETQLDLHYEETVDTKYLQETTISSTLEGFFDEIKRDPEAEKKYFTTLYLDDWDRKVTRIVKPVVNWPDLAQKWIGEPVAFMSVQIGYPSASGDIQWAPHVFQSTDTGDATTWQVAMAKKNAADVANPPSGWTPDVTYVKRQIHFNEPPGETDSPYTRIFVEQNVVDLDPGDHGTPMDEGSIEVRADSVGKLEVGPIALNIDLESAKQVVEVEFKASGKRADGSERGVTRFSWMHDDQAEARRWEIYTGQLDYKPEYEYRVHVLVKGSIFSKGVEWWGPWQPVTGNGPMMVSVPMQDDPGVTTRRLTPREIASSSLSPIPPPRPALVASGNGADTGIGPPPRERTSPALRLLRNVPGAGEETVESIFGYSEAEAIASGSGRPPGRSTPSGVPAKSKPARSVAKSAARAPADGALVRAPGFTAHRTERPLRS